MLFHSDLRIPIAFVAFDVLRLEHPDGTPADPPTIRSAVPNWEIGDQIPRGPQRRTALRSHLRPESAVFLREAEEHELKTTSGLRPWNDEGVDRFRGSGSLAE
jgi:hypothetical protein